jgi:hypothetical protein
MSTDGHAWKRACNFLSNIVKTEELSCNGLSQAMKHGCTTMNLQANVKEWSRNRTKKFKTVPSASRVILTLFLGL